MLQANTTDSSADVEMNGLFSIGGLSVNAFGVLYFIETLFWSIWWALGLLVCGGVLELSDRAGLTLDPARRSIDALNRLWGFFMLTTINSMPVIVNPENLPPNNETCVYVANHASWMDIPAVGMLPRFYKFVAKAELLKVPILGLSIMLSDQVILERDDKRSQIKAYRQCQQILKTGYPLFVFPEGTRSRDGRLKPFGKGGAFKLAQQMNLPVVPVTIEGTHAMMPPTALVPLKPAAGTVKLHIHPKIHPTGFTEDQLREYVWRQIGSALPESQQPLKDDLDTNEAVIQTLPTQRHDKFSADHAAADAAAADKWGYPRRPARTERVRFSELLFMFRQPVTKNPRLINRK
ncbi:unnamed protein product [Vitrella brassicaformis CCMP3155]|uniref:Phospholipid/glycerol acyltransferase domain-containing protein n=1 Tax=Vitrella brassicaformis (strain CCMP3155) TaxID=1169540 RepID=A0A0G4G4P0_VITBC|nr:unnamed protein product [Vitrella brassicaformis CCMP3155]|eukprot:CEM23232.1 unnamed protein product [Vitrella brassicaformis CCMP3155]